MAFQVDLSTAAGRREIAKLNASIDMTSAKLGSATGAAARLSAQMQKTGANPLREVVASMNSLNLTMGRVVGTWGKINSASTYTSDKMATKLKLLQKEVKRLTNESRRAKKSQDGLGGALGTNSQKAAAFRAAMYASHTHMGMFTANTLAAATSVYALVSAIRSTISVGATYEKSMQRVFTITDALGSVPGQITPEMDMLSAAVMKVGKTTIFTATQVAEGAVQFAMAGFSAKETSEALSATASLAAIGMTDMATAAGTAANILNAFGMEAKDLEMVVDRMAVAVTGSMMDIKQLATALSYVGPLANDTNTSFKDTVIILELMHDAGIKASKAGTALRRGMVNMLNPTAKQLKVLAGLNVATKDAQGEMRSMLAISRDLAAKGIKPAGIATLFGARAVAAWTQVIGEASKEANGLTNKLTEFEKAQERAAGKSKELRENLERNLIDQFKLLVSAIQEVQQQIFVGLAPALTSLTQGVTAFVKSLSMTALKQFVGMLAIAITSAGVFKLALFALNIATLKTVIAVVALKIAALKTITVMGALTGAFRALTVVMSVLAKHPLLIAITAAVTIWALFRDRVKETATEMDRFAGKADKAREAMEKAGRGEPMIAEWNKIDDQMQDLFTQRLNLIEAASDAEAKGIEKGALAGLQKAIADAGARLDDLADKRQELMTAIAKKKGKGTLFNAMGIGEAIEGLTRLNEMSVTATFKKEVSAVTDEGKDKSYALSSDKMLAIDKQYQERRAKLVEAYSPRLIAAANEVTSATIKLSQDVSDVEHKVANDRLAKANSTLNKLGEIYRDGDDKLMAQRSSALDKQLEKEREHKKAVEQLYLEHQQRSIENNVAGIEQQSALKDLEYSVALDKLRTQMDTLGIMGEERRAIELELDASHYAAKEQMWFTHWDTMYGIEAESFDAMKGLMDSFREGDLAGMAHHGKTALKEFAKHSRAMFEVQKVAAIADATISAGKGIARTLSEYPYPWNLGFAALHAVAAYGQIKSIQSQQFQGGGSVSTPAGGGGGGAAAPSTSSALPATAGVTQTKDVTITVDGFDPDSQYVLSGEMIVTLMQQAANDGIPLPV